MENKTKNEIVRLRQSGMKCAEVSAAVGVPVGTVKTVMKRWPVVRCERCGKPLSGKQGRFCSGLCRTRWWNEHRDCAERICPACGKPFTPKDDRRVYCCEACFHESRKKH